MKLLQTFIFVLFVQVVFSQVLDIEQRYNKEEQKLYQLEQELNNTKNSFAQYPQSVEIANKLNSLKQQVKAQKSVVKSAKKELKAYQKSLVVVNPENSVSTVQQSAIVNTVDDKGKVKALSKEIKSLTKQRKTAEKLATSVGIDPTTDGTVQAIQNKIDVLQSQLNELQPKPVEIPVVNSPSVQKPMVETPQSVVSSVNPVKELKAEIKALKKQKKVLLKEAKLMQVDASKDNKIIVLQEKLYTKEVEYAQMMQLPMPVQKQLPNYSVNGSKQAVQAIPSQSNVTLPANDTSAQLKVASKEFKTLQKQYRKAVKTALGQQINPAEDKTVQVLEKQIKDKQAELYQLQQGIVPQVNNVEATSNQQKTVEETQNYPTIGISTILFEKYSSEVREDYNKYISYVAKQLNENPELALNINAYTDNTEKGRTSYELTQKMMLSVAQEFVNRGIDKSRLIVQAEGARMPIGDNKTFYGQARNRRVELSFAPMPKVVQ